MTRRCEREKHDASKLPREGSALRRAYDLLAAGAVVNLYASFGKCQGHAIGMQLRLFYDCELARAPHGEGTRMLGRWDGETFVPIERLLQEAA